MTNFKKAERRQVKVKLAITGPSGSGKTFSALLIAAGMGKRIAVIDAENGSASLYADMDKGPLKGVAFDVLELDPPYIVPKYLDAMNTAIQAGYDVLIIDGISPAWAGEGGLLDKKAALDMRPNTNSYTNWNRITPEQERFKSRILQAPIHMICTMRSKQDYVLETNDKGKQAPRKVGMAPIQRDGMEYEFTVVLDLAIDHHAEASKDRTSLFDGQVFRPSRQTGEQIMSWLASGKPMEIKSEPEPVPAPSARPAPGPAEEPIDAAEPDPGPLSPEEESFSTPDIQTQLSAALKALYDLGIRPVTIWAGISKEVQEKHGVMVVESTGLNEVTGPTAIDYLNRWAAFLRTSNGKPTSRRPASRQAAAGV